MEEKVERSGNRDKKINEINYIERKVVCINIYKHLYIDVYMYVCMYVCMYVYIYICM